MRMTSNLSSPQVAPGASAGHGIVVHLNGERRETRAATLAQLIEEAGYGQSRVATALNGEFVPQRARGSTALKSGDHVEIVAPRQGG